MSRSVTTIRGFIGLLKKIAHTDVELFRGIEKLTPEQIKIMTDARGDAYNYIGEIEEFLTTHDRRKEE